VFIGLSLGITDNVLENENMIMAKQSRGGRFICSSLPQMDARTQMCSIGGAQVRLSVRRLISGLPTS
jgi:hypothetical protein